MTTAVAASAAAFDETQLQLAAELLATHGWCHNALRDRQGRLCIAGACVAAAQELCDERVKLDGIDDFEAWFRRWPTAARALAGVILGSEHTEDSACVPIMLWNDTTCRSVEHAQHVLRVAAQRVATAAA